MILTDFKGHPARVWGRGSRLSKQQRPRSTKRKCATLVPGIARKPLWLLAVENTAGKTTKPRPPRASQAKRRSEKMQMCGAL